MLAEAAVILEAARPGPVLQGLILLDGCATSASLAERTAAAVAQMRLLGVRGGADDFARIGERRADSFVLQHLFSATARQQREGEVAAILAAVAQQPVGALAAQAAAWAARTDLPALHGIRELAHTRFLCIAGEWSSRSLEAVEFASFLKPGAATPCRVNRAGALVSIEAPWALVEPVSLFLTGLGIF